MKKHFLFIIVFICQLPIAYCQLKISKATQQKTFSGMGGVFMNYIIELKNKSTDTIIIDSVKTIADTSELRFSAMKMKTGNYQITFSFAIVPPPKCKTCVEATPKPSNLTKGIFIYYRKKNERAILKIKKFKKLPDVMLP